MCPNCVLGFNWHFYFAQCMLAVYWHCLKDCREVLIPVDDLFLSCIHFNYMKFTIHHLTIINYPFTYCVLTCSHKISFLKNCSMYEENTA